MDIENDPAKPPILIDLEKCEDDKLSNISNESECDELENDLDIVINEELIRKGNEKLQTRIDSLKQTINDLKETLSQEKDLWRQEIEAVITTHNQYLVSHAMCLTDCFYNEYKDYEQDSEMDKKSSEGSKSDMDLPHIKYRSTLMKNRRLHMLNYHNVAINNYRKKLLEVENMCNLELKRVRNSFQSLQPLQIMAAEWDHSYASGDYNNKFDSNKDNSNNKTEEIICETNLNDNLQNETNNTTSLSVEYENTNIV